MDVYPEGGVSRRRSRAPGGVCAGGGGPAAAELSEVLIRAGPGLHASLTALPSPQAPSCQNSARVRSSALLGRSAGPSPGDAGAEGRRLLPPATARLFFFSFFFSPFPPSSFRLLPTLELSIYSSEAQGKCAMFVDFSLYVDQDRNQRVLIFSLLGRGFAWLISLSILAKFVVVVVPWVICRGSEGQRSAA